MGAETSILYSFIMPYFLVLSCEKNYAPQEHLLLYEDLRQHSQKHCKNEEIYQTILRIALTIYNVQKVCKNHNQDYMHIFLNSS